MGVKKIKKADFQSMTGFGTATGSLARFGTASVDLRSSNHKYLEIVLHLPNGFMVLEDYLKKEVEKIISRGRITLVVNVGINPFQKVSVNKGLFKDYYRSIKDVQNEFHINGEIGIANLLNLQGVLSLCEDKADARKYLPELKKIFQPALDGLLKSRKKEGQALRVYLKNHGRKLKEGLVAVTKRFNHVVAEKVKVLKTEDEKSCFLKNSDIGEELERLEYHIRNFIHKLDTGGILGKELDFIAQEMQRETNTIGAKSCDAVVSGHVIQLKSEVERIREQVQNVE